MSRALDNRTAMRALDSRAASCELLTAGLQGTATTQTCILKDNLSTTSLPKTDNFLAFAL